MAAGTSIKGFIEASFIDWPRKVASVVFLPSCNFRCPFCHNSGLILSPDDFEDFSLDGVMEEIEANAGFIDGVVVTGGEPTVSKGFFEMLEQFRLRGVPVKLDTNGSKPELLEKALKNDLVSAVAMDIKAPLTPEEYSRAAGRDIDISAIKESINLLLTANVEVYFRTTVVPVLHDESSVRRIKQEIQGHSLILQNFRPAEALDPSFRKMMPFGADEFDKLKKVVEVTL
ncbi:MAG: anaerobic ribonucleoside-triphosphate reductase activating protein [Nitrospirota bacterium]